MRIKYPVIESKVFFFKLFIHFNLIILKHILLLSLFVVLLY